MAKPTHKTCDLSQLLRHKHLTDDEKSAVRFALQRVADAKAAEHEVALLQSCLRASLVALESVPWENGVTDPTGQADEGRYRMAEFYGHLHRTLESSRQAFPGSQGPAACAPGSTPPVSGVPTRHTPSAGDAAK